MVTVVGTYLGTPRDRFDLAYYTTRHVALARRLLEPHGLTGLRVLSGFEPPAGDAPGMLVVSEMSFATREGFDAGVAAHGAELFADIANFTDVTPMLQVCSEAQDL